MNIFKSAITEGDGVTVNVGYLALFWVLVVVLGVVPMMVVGAWVTWWKSPTHVFPLQELGVGVGAVCGGFATALGALGIFVWGDSRKPDAPAPAPEPVKEDK